MVQTLLDAAAELVAEKATTRVLKGCLPVRASLAEQLLAVLFHDQLLAALHSFGFFNLDGALLAPQRGIQ